MPFSCQAHHGLQTTSTEIVRKNDGDLVHIDNYVISDNDKATSFFLFKKTKQFLNPIRKNQRL